MLVSQKPVRSCEVLPRGVRAERNQQEHVMKLKPSPRPFGTQRLIRGCSLTLNAAGIFFL